MDTKQKRNFLFKDNLQMIPEANENSYGYSNQNEKSNINSQSKFITSLHKKPGQISEFTSPGNVRDLTGKNNYNNNDAQFTKIPKFTFSTISRKQSDTDSYVKNPLATQNFTPLVNSSTGNFLTSGIGSTSQLNSTPLNLSLCDALLISNFPENLLEKVIKEFESYGKIEELNYSNKENILYIKYADQNDVIYAYNKHNPSPQWQSNNNKLIVVPTKSSNYQIQFKNEQNQAVSQYDIPLPSASHINYLWDFLFSC